MPHGHLGVSVVGTPSGWFFEGKQLGDAKHGVR